LLDYVTCILSDDHQTIVPDTDHQEDVSESH